MGCNGHSPLCKQGVISSNLISSTTPETHLSWGAFSSFTIPSTAGVFRLRDGLIGLKQRRGEYGNLPSNAYASFRSGKDSS